MKDQYNLIQEQAADTRRQAEIMEKQSHLMQQNMEYDLLLKQRERLVKEITLFVGPLFAKITDSSIFKLERRSQAVLVRARGMDEERYYYNTFWSDVYQNIYLNHSDVLRNALNKYNAKIDAYFEAKLQNKPADDLRKLEDDFNDHIKPDFISTISKRYSELDAELKKIDEELKIRKWKSIIFLQHNLPWPSPHPPVLPLQKDREGAIIYV